MDTSNAVFESYIADYAEMNAGLTSDSWKMCSVRNSTYVDCPVVEDTKEFAITSYNPATVDVEVQTFKVPPTGSYDVEAFDYDTKTWSQVESTLLCYDYLVNDADHSTFEDCNLHVQCTARAHHMSYLKLKANPKAGWPADSVVSAFGLLKDLTGDEDTITTSKASLKYTGQTDDG